MVGSVQRESAREGTGRRIRLGDAARKGVVERERERGWNQALEDKGRWHFWMNEMEERSSLQRGISDGGSWSLCKC